MSEERMPVNMTEEAREFMYSSGPESAKFAQALGEAFQLAALPVTITMSTIDKNDLFATTTSGEMLIKTQVDPVEKIGLPVVMPSFIMYTNSDDLKQMRGGTIYGFNALRTAQECVRLYRQHYRIAQ